MTPLDAAPAFSAPQPVEYLRETKAMRWADPSLSPMAMECGKRWFNHGDGVLPYTETGRFRLGFGEPLTSPRLRPVVIRAFFETARRDKIPAAVLPVSAAVARASGQRSLFIGETAAIDLEAFDLSGNRRKTVRQSINRLERLGYRFRLMEPPHAESVIEQLLGVSREWLATKRVPENRFVMGWFDPPEIARSSIGVVQSDDGAIVAFATLHRTETGAALDLLRYGPSAPSGALDLLVGRLAETLRNTGHVRLDLGLAPLARGPKTPEPLAAPLRTVAWIAERGAWYGCAGLRRFKEKFRPVWSPRYAVYRSTPDLAAVFRLTTGLFHF